ncbi:MAG TPA: HAMP domain-containing sensor histidine kinase [Candidatus Angelobacter sp.]
MKLPLKERVLLSGVVFALAAVLVALAILQYRWAREVSDATSTRLQASLDSSMLSWRDDFYRELSTVASALQADPALPSREKAAQYAQQFQTWTQSSSHPNLVSRIFLLEGAGTENSQLVQLDTAKHQFVPGQLPQELNKLDGWLKGMSSGRMRRVHAAQFRFHQEAHRGDPGNDPLLRPGGVNAEIPAMFDPSGMALVRPQIHFDLSKNQAAEPPKPVVDLLVIQLDPKVLQEHIFPELVERHFSGTDGLDYQVAILRGASAVVYSSDQGFGTQDAASADEKIAVFGPPHGPPPRRGANPGFGPGPHVHATQHQRAGVGFAGPVRVEAIRYASPDDDWQLLARHRKGSLEAVVAGMRHRNLAVSFGVLLVLTAGIGMILISSQRARMLARLQMDFVASVSHELRTPLAVISSAAENITDGVVAGKQQLSQYGAEIKNQARHLIQLVEQILLFAATRNKRHHYNLRPLRVEDVIEAALKDTAGMIEENRIVVEQEIAPNLPPVIGDLTALSHCLQNLITNAIKYGGDARWMRIKAGVNEENGRLEEVQITVEDKGLGIGASELRHIFEPFYRSRTAAAAQIHGTGLGLPLARDIAEAMGGRLTVTSEPGKGSCFMLYLKFADVSVVQTSARTAAVINPNV